MKPYPSVVVLLCVLLSVDTTWGSNHHEDRFREEQDRGGRTIEVSSSSSNGSSSSEDSSPRTVTRKATKKTTATPTSAPTPSLQMFLEQYPEVKDRSAEEQAHLYMVYKLHLNGATPDNLAKYQTVTFNFFDCRKDEDSAALNQNVDAWLDQRIGKAQTSWGCQITTEPGDDPGSSINHCSPLPTGIPVPNRLNITGLAQCEIFGWGTAEACCRSSPNSRVGTTAWPWSDCV